MCTYLISSIFPYLSCRFCYEPLGLPSIKVRKKNFNCLHSLSRTAKHHEHHQRTQLSFLELSLRRLISCSIDLFISLLSLRKKDSRVKAQSKSERKHPDESTASSQKFPMTFRSLVTHHLQKSK